MALFCCLIYTFLALSVSSSHKDWDAREKDTRPGWEAPAIWCPMHTAPRAHAPRSSLQMKVCRYWGLNRFHPKSHVEAISPK